MVHEINGFASDDFPMYINPDFDPIMPVWASGLSSAQIAQFVKKKSRYE